MIRNRKLVLVVAAAVAVSFSLGTAGFSSASADRGIDVNVVDDQQAYLGFEQQSINTDNGTTTVEVTIANQFPAGTAHSEVRVSIIGTPDDRTADSQLGVGERQTHRFESVPCNGTIAVEVDDPGTRLDFERAVSCGLAV